MAFVDGDKDNYVCSAGPQSLLGGDARIICRVQIILASPSKRCKLMLGKKQAGGDVKAVTA